MTVLCLDFKCPGSFGCHSEGSHLHVNKSIYSAREKDTMERERRSENGKL